MSPIKSLPPNPTGLQVKQALGHDLSPFTSIVVDKNNAIINPDTAKSPQGGAVLWIVYNNDNATHDVGIDPTKFKIKSTGVYVNPLVGSTPMSVSVAPSKFAHLVGVIRPDAQVAEYKYTITSDGTPLDPDLDVVDP